MIQKIRKSKAGFTLVELIVVVAIIGVLAAVLAPQYLKYIENSRIAVDQNAADEIAHAVEIAIANETVYDGLPASTFTVTYLDAANTVASSATVSELIAEVNQTLGVAAKAVDFKSKAHNGDTVTVTVTYSATDKTFTVGNAVLA